jgi:hypothetical protein
MKQRSPSKSFLVTGGLGNQLFIFSAGTYYSLQNNEKVIFDFSRYTKRNKPHTSDIRSLSPDAFIQYRPFRCIFKAELNKISKRVLFPTYTYSGVGYDPGLEKHILENQIFGYFQTYRYLEKPQVRRFIDSLFIDISPVSECFSKFSLDMLEIPTISVHIRRGDYMNLRDTFGILDSDYYASAIKFTLENSTIRYSRVLVFSDDIALAKRHFSNLEISLPVEFLESPDISPEETLLLMSQSDAIVISNSTFSWWAAQLGYKKKFIVRPSKWFRGMLDPEDLFPPEWHAQESIWET